MVLIDSLVIIKETAAADYAAIPDVLKPLVVNYIGIAIGDKLEGMPSDSVARYLHTKFKNQAQKQLSNGKVEKAIADFNHILLSVMTMIHAFSGI